MNSLNKDTSSTLSSLASRPVGATYDVTSSSMMRAAPSADMLTYAREDYGSESDDQREQKELEMEMM